jgi:O-antigen ligase
MVWLLIGYMFLYIDRPFEVWPALGAVHLERVYMIVTLFVYLAWLPSRARWISNWQHWPIFAFAMAVLISWAASPWSDTCDATVENWFKLMLFFLLLVTVVHSERDLRRIVLAFLVVMSLYMTHSLWEYLHGRHEWMMGTYRLTGVNAVSSDPNTFSATIVYALPLVLSFWRAERTPRMRAFLIVFVLLSVLCVLLTGSRGSFLGLVLLALLLAATGRKRMRLLILLAVVAPLIWFALPAQLQKRFESIIHPEAGTVGARMSAEGRIEGFLTGLELWQKYPLTGCGPGAWQPATETKLESHNLYGQVLGELGTLGTLAFAGFLLGCWSNIRRIRQLHQITGAGEGDWCFHLSQSIAMALILMLLLGFFGHSLFRFNWMWYGGFLMIARYCMEQRWRTLQSLSYGWHGEAPFSEEISRRPDFAKPLPTKSC